MRLFAHRPLGATLIAGWALALSACDPVPAQFCQLGLECTDRLGTYDPVPGTSPDSADVCTVNQETYLKALRVNHEEICHEIAEAWEEWMLCVVEEDTCDSFKPFEPDCKEERRRHDDLAREAGNRCNE